MTVKTPTTTREEFEAAYVKAREANRRPGATIQERDNAADRAEHIAALAERAGHVLDVIALDERARLNIYG